MLTSKRTPPLTPTNPPIAVWLLALTVVAFYPRSPALAASLTDGLLAFWTADGNATDGTGN